MDYLVVEARGEEAVFARFRARNGRLALQEAVRQPADDEPAFAASLAEGAAADQGRSRVIFLIDPRSLFFREIEIPITDRRKLREVLPLELKGETALDTDELAFDGIPLEGGKLLALWGRKRELAATIAAMRQAGLEPAVVTASMCHWHLLLPEEGMRGYAALTDGAALAVYHDGRPLFLRALRMADFPGELERTLASLEIAGGVRVERVFLHGEVARRVPEGVGDRPLLPIDGDLLAAFGGDRAAARDLAGALAAASACLKGEPVNFRYGELAYTAGMEQARKGLRLSAALAAILALLLLADAGLRYYLARSDLASLDSSIRGIYREVFPGRKKATDEVGELKAEIRRLGGGAGGTEVLPVLKKMAEAKGDEITGVYEAEIEGNQVRLKGEARSYQAVNDFKGRFAPGLAAVEVGEVKSRPDGGVAFVLKGTLKEGGK